MAPGRDAVAGWLLPRLASARRTLRSVERAQPTKSYLSIIASSNALAWVLATERMAFPASRASQALALRPGDHLLLYTTRGCFRNPTRDRGRVIGLADVSSAPQRLDRALIIDGRPFHVTCRLKLRALAPSRQGVELGPISGRLSVFPHPASWSAWMRRALLPLPEQDAALVLDALYKLALAPKEHIGDYVNRRR